MKLSATNLIGEERERAKKENEFWAASVKERDKWNCAICGSFYHPNAHHIIPRENKEYLLELDNGITLCTKHHKFSRVISAHNSPIAFFLWLQRFRPSLFVAAVERTKLNLKKEGIELC